MSQRTGIGRFVMIGLLVIMRGTLTSVAASNTSLKIKSFDSKFLQLDLYLAA